MVELRERGLYVVDIAGKVGLSQSTVVSWLNAGCFPERKRPKKKKPSPVAPYAEYLERRWRERCINMSRLWREIKEMGYEGSYDAVADHLRCLRKGLAPPAFAPVANEESGGSPKGSRYESQEAARLLMLETKDPEALRPEQSQWLEELRVRSPELAAVQKLAGRFAIIIREGGEGELGAWIAEAENLCRYSWRQARRNVLRQGSLSKEWTSHRGRHPVRLTRKGVEVKLADGVQTLSWKRIQNQVGARRS